MALTHEALAGADKEVPMPGSLFSGDPTVRVGRRFLPVAAAALPPISDRDGLVALPLAPATPVHAIEAGRVVSAEGATAGEVVIRIESEVRVVYRRLLPSSVTVEAGDMVAAGDVIGVVAPSSGNRLVTLELGVQNPDGSWEKLSSWLTGLPDPLELYLRPPGAPRPAAERAQPAAAAQSAGFTVVKAQPDEPESETPEPDVAVPTSGPETTEMEIAKPSPAEPQPEPEPGAPEAREAEAKPAGQEPAAAKTEPVQPSGPQQARRSADAPQSEPKPAQPQATGASALTSRRRRGRPGQPAPSTPQPEPAGAESSSPAPTRPAPPEPHPAPVVEPTPVAEPAPVVEPTPVPEIAPTTGEPAHEPGPEPAPPEPEPEPVPEPEPAVTVVVPEAVQTEPAPSPEADPDGAGETDTAGDSNRATQASRLTSRRQRPKRSRQ